MKGRLNLLLLSILLLPTLSSCTKPPKQSNEASLPRVESDVWEGISDSDNDNSKVLRGDGGNDADTSSDVWDGIDEDSKATDEATIGGAILPTNVQGNSEAENHFSQVISVVKV